MFRKYFPILLAFLILSVTAWFVLSEVFSRERCVQKIEVPEEYLETMDTSRYAIQSILLERTYKDDSLLILFPVENKKSEVYLYDQKNYFRLLLGYSDVVSVSQENRDLLRAVFDRPVVNLSGLSPGKYYLHATSCNFGGYFEITISDDKALD